MTDILTAEECVKLEEIEAKMTPEEWAYSQSNGAPFGYIANAEFILLGVPHDNYSPEPMRTNSNNQADVNARGVVELRNAAPRLFTTIAAFRAFYDQHYKSESEINRALPDIGEALMAHGVSVGVYPEAFTAAHAVTGEYACRIAAHEATIAELTAVTGRKCRCDHYEVQHKPVHSGNGIVCGVFGCPAKCIAFESVHGEGTTA